MLTDLWTTHCAWSLAWVTASSSLFLDSTTCSSARWCSFCRSSNAVLRKTTQQQNTIIVIIYVLNGIFRLRFKWRFPGEPGFASSTSGFFFQSFQKRTSEVKWHIIFLQAGHPSCRTTNNVKALKEAQSTDHNQKNHPPVYIVHHHHHNHFTALFLGPPGWTGARRELLDFMVQGKINRGRHTDHPAGRHSIRTNQCPPPLSSPYFYRPDALPAAQPTASKHWRQDQFIYSAIDKNLQFILNTRMWANAQPDGRPAEHRWRPLFNAAKFAWRPLLDAVQ